MTRIGKAVCGIVAVIITLSIFVTLIISIILSSEHNEETYGLMANIGVRVLKSDVERKQENLESTFELWRTQNKMTSALKNGYVGTLAEVFDTADIDENVFCMFTDAEGNIVWKSDNYTLTSYDVSLPLSYDVSKDVSGYRAGADFRTGGFYVDDSGTLSCVYAAPIIFGDSLLVGTCLLGYDLTSTDFLDDIKEQTGNDIAIFSGNTIESTTLMIDEETRNTGDTMNEAAAEAVLTNGEIYDGKHNILNNGYFVHYEPITDIYGNICGAYFAGQSTDQNVQAFKNIVVISLIAAVVIIIVSLIAVNYFLRSVVVKPIVKVSSLAENMSRGELSIPDFDYKFGNNEVGDFAVALQNTKHSLADYIKDISGVLNAMAYGDFTVKPAMKYEGDFVQIEQSFEEIQNQLSEIVRSINRSSEQVLTGSAQMANGSQILANGTTTQANAIEELNATIMSISEKTVINAQNALHAKSLSAGVEESAVAQNEDMNRVMNAMRDIEAKSSEIGNIIQTIEDIAFQTNILALNAAVEAARAGEAGKGFAVVADEVRNLASMSAEAAKDTTDLISATVMAVNDGSVLVRTAVDSMAEITEKAKETSRLIDEISDASNTQAEAIRQVTTGLEQISEVVQENSATAEETAASCEQLSGQSQVLRNQVSKLKA